MSNSTPNSSFVFTRDQASAFARLALKGIRQEYPNKPDHVMNSAADVRSPRELHPAFYGSYDWHSCVHGHWMLARLLRRFPDLPEQTDIRSAFNDHLTAANIKVEAEYFAQPGHKSFERTYGWAWLLKLDEELILWDDPDARRWASSLRPIADEILRRYLEFLPKQTYPIRTGVHPNTSFGLAFALDYARETGNKVLGDLVTQRARDYFASDEHAPVEWEPGGSDFFSPSLMEADLMRRVLAGSEFRAWLHKFLPGAFKAQPARLFEPAIVSDRSDPQLVHLDGLNLSRAWCMRGIASALSSNDPAKRIMEKSAARHAESALRHVASGHYEGEHWLASFAVFLLTEH